MIRVILALFFCWALRLPAQVPVQTPEQSLSSTAAQLAARTSSLLPRRATVSLELQNLTEIPGVEWSSFRKLLQDELRKAGVETVGLGTAGTPPESGSPSPSSRVRVTLSEDTRGRLLVAEVFTGDNRQIAMLRWNPPSSAQTKPRISITKKVFWTEAEPILDMLLVDSDSEMLILDADKIVSFRWMGNKWTPSATASLVLPRPLPRDPRGRLEAMAGGFEAFLPVATCTGAWNPELKSSCAGGTTSWPGTFGTHWVADRNVLDGDAPGPSFEGWGSDWASIADPCGAGTVLIASSANNEQDSVRAYQVVDRQATPLSDAQPTSGPVTALWPSESGREATLVVHNLQTGEYEASRLGLACTE
jgi:hypothetical protein